MSKRARITLNPDAETEPTADTGEASVQATGPDAKNGSLGMAGSQAEPAAATKRMPRTGVVFSAVVVGLAVASLVLLWARRRP